MDGLDTSTLHVPGRLHVEILEQCGTCIGRDIIVIDRDADAIAPCLPPENSGHGSVNIEFWINMLVRFQHGTCFVCQLGKTLASFEGYDAWPDLALDCCPGIGCRLVLKDHDRNHRHAIGAYLELHAVEALVGLERVRRPGNRASRILMRGNPGNSLEQQAISMPRILSRLDCQEFRGASDVVCGCRRSGDICSS